MTTNFTQDSIDRVINHIIYLRKPIIAYCTVCNLKVSPLTYNCQLTSLACNEYVEYNNRYYLLCGRERCRDKISLTPSTYFTDDN